MTSGSPPELLVAVLTHNGATVLGASLPLIRASLPRSYHITVIDNGSSDETARLVTSHEGVELFSTGENLSPAAAYNRLLDEVPPELAILRIDDDVIPLPSALQRLVTSAFAADVGVAGATLLSADGQIQHAGGEVQRPGDPGFDSWCVHSNTLDRRSGPTAWVSGACMLLSPAARALVPRFDERFRFWFEDIDYCFALRAHGLKVQLVREAEVYHLSSGDAIESPVVIESHRRFVNKWRSSRHLWAPPCCRDLADQIVQHSEINLR